MDRVVQADHLLSQDCLDAMTDYENDEWIEPAVYEEMIKYFQNEFRTFKKIKNNWVYND
jgi:hypothetical protein